MSIPKDVHQAFSEQKKDIENPQFWAKRLEWAKRANQIHLSVYYTERQEWDRIEIYAKQLIRRFIKSTDYILEGGCGYGRIVRAIPEGAKYLGIDRSVELLTEAKRLFSHMPNVYFLEGNLLDLPFKDKIFDWAVCSSVKGMVTDNLGQHVWDKMQIEIQRVAKKVLIFEYGSYKKQEYEIL